MGFPVNTKEFLKNMDKKSEDQFREVMIQYSFVDFMVSMAQLIEYFVYWNNNSNQEWLLFVIDGWLWLGLLMHFCMRKSAWPNGPSRTLTHLFGAQNALGIPLMWFVRLWLIVTKQILVTYVLGIILALWLSIAKVK